MMVLAFMVQFPTTSGNADEFTPTESGSLVSIQTALPLVGSADRHSLGHAFAIKVSFEYQAIYSDLTTRKILFTDLKIESATTDPGALGERQIQFGITYFNGVDETSESIKEAMLITPKYFDDDTSYGWTDIVNWNSATINGNANLLNDGLDHTTDHNVVGTNFQVYIKHYNSGYTSAVTQMTIGQFKLVNFPDPIYFTGEFQIDGVSPFLNNYRIKQIDASLELLGIWEQDFLIPNAPNFPPDKPGIPIGPSSLDTGELGAYRLNIIDPDSAYVNVYVDWNNGHVSILLNKPVGVNFYVYYSYPASGTYYIQVYATDGDRYSEFSEPKQLVVSNPTGPPPPCGTFC